MTTLGTEDEEAEDAEDADVEAEALLLGDVLELRELEVGSKGGGTRISTCRHPKVSQAE